MPGLYTHTTRSSGITLTASIYNSDHQQHIDFMEPEGMDDLSIDVAEMQTTTDPGEVGSESLPTSLGGELQRLRFSLKEIKGTAQWYETPTVSLQGIITSTTTTTSGSNTLVDADQGTLLIVTGTNTQTLPDASSVGEGWAIVIFNNGTGTVTVEGNGSQTVNGFANIKLYPRDSVVLTSDGSNFLGVEARAGVGDIRMHGGSSEPPWGFFCNGQAVSRTTYAQLFAIVGTTYGVGDGSTTFNVPDYRDRFPLGENTMGSSDAGRVNNQSTALGDTGGSDQVTTTEAQEASHNHGGSTGGGGNHSHGVLDSQGRPVVDDTAGNQTSSTELLGTVDTNDAASNQYDTDSSGNHSHGISTAGSDNAHENMPPFQTSMFVMVF